MSEYSKSVYDRPNPKRKPGFDRGMIVASIAHKNAFRVVYRLPSIPRRIVGGGWIVSKSPLERNRQFTRRIDVASQQRRQSASSLLARVPGVQQNRNLIQQEFISTLPPENKITTVLGFFLLRSELIDPADRAVRTTGRYLRPRFHHRSRHQ